MATSKIHLNSKLKLAFRTEPDINNKQTTKTRTLNNARPEADSETLYDLALKMSGLQKHSLIGIYTQDEYELVKE